MKLKEWDWNKQQYVEVEYPDEIVKDFVDRLRNTKQWRESPDPGRDVYTMFRRFEGNLADAKARAAREAVKPDPLAKGREEFRRLKERVAELGLTPKGTGKKDAVTKADLERALEEHEKAAAAA